MHPTRTMAIVCATLASLSTARAADFERRFVPETPIGVLDEPALGSLRRLPPPPPIGGPFLYVPGLNGPAGPPVYPLLPFAFGYGY